MNDFEMGRKIALLARDLDEFKNDAQSELLKIVAEHCVLVMHMVARQLLRDRAGEVYCEEDAPSCNGGPGWGAV